MVRSANLLAVTVLMIFDKCVSLPSLVNSSHSISPSKAALPLQSRAVLDRSCHIAGLDEQIEQVIGMIALITNHAVDATRRERLSSDALARNRYSWYFRDPDFSALVSVRGHFQSIYFESLQSVAPEQAEEFAQMVGYEPDRPRPPLRIDCSDSERRCRATHPLAYLGERDNNKVNLVYAHLNLVHLIVYGGVARLHYLSCTTSILYPQLRQYRTMANDQTYSPLSSETVPSQFCY